jgi:hypothetical protein
MDARRSAREAGNADDAREDVRRLQSSPAKMARPEEDDAAAVRGGGGGGSRGISDVSVEPSRLGGGAASRKRAGRQRAGGRQRRRRTR